MTDIIQTNEKYRKVTALWHNQTYLSRTNATIFSSNSLPRFQWWSPCFRFPSNAVRSAPFGKALRSPRVISSKTRHHASRRWNGTSYSISSSVPQCSLIHGAWRVTVILTVLSKLSLIKNMSLPQYCKGFVRCQVQCLFNGLKCLHQTYICRRHRLKSGISWNA